jgi:RNA polymerase sigma-70 factor, ECF subfamily
MAAYRTFIGRTTASFPQCAQFPGGDIVHMYTYTERTTGDGEADRLTDSADCTNLAPTHEHLLDAARSGDRAARQSLYARCLPTLRRWAQGCLPREQRGINDADDLVQIVLMRALNRLADFETRGANSFLAYLHQIMLNEVRSDLRKQRRRGEAVECDDTLATDGDPVVAQMLGLERELAYAGALRRLNPRQQEHIALRIDFGMSFREIASRVGGSADGARMTVTRGLRTMTEHLASAAA